MYYWLSKGPSTFFLFVQNNFCSETYLKSFTFDTLTRCSLIINPVSSPKSLSRVWGHYFCCYNQISPENFKLFPLEAAIQHGHPIPVNTIDDGVRLFAVVLSDRNVVPSSMWLSREREKIKRHHKNYNHEFYIFQFWPHNKTLLFPVTCKFQKRFICAIFYLQ